MPTTIPYIPSYITVHLGAPDSAAENVTVSFRDYVKNVASSEVYPTWDPSALRANILAITSFALNRVYTEFYRSRGYPFDITNNTAYDQQFVEGRNFFDSISVLVDTLYDDYLRRIGSIEPLAAKFCSGTTVTCNGLSQWGSEYLARQGFDAMRILRYYYGDNIELVNNAPQLNLRESYPGTAFRRGSRGRNGYASQRDRNRISQNFPAIPKIKVDGIYGPDTENAVRVFQSVFGLEADGIVGKSTWYTLERVYVGVLQLSELESEGLRFADISFAFPGGLRIGDTGERVAQLQYMLSVVGEFVPSVPVLTVDGVFGRNTRDAVIAFQNYAGLTADGIVGETTWGALYEQYSGIDNRILQSAALFPMQTAVPATNPGNAGRRLRALGYSGNSLQQQLLTFQRANGLPVNGRLNTETAGAITAQYQALQYADSTRMTQYPGSPLSVGSRDV